MAGAYKIFESIIEVKFYHIHFGQEKNMEPRNRFLNLRFALFVSLQNDHQNLLISRPRLQNIACEDCKFQEKKKEKKKERKKERKSLPKNK